MYELQIFSPIHKLSFYFPDDVRHTKVFNFDEVQFIYFRCYCSWLVITSKPIAKSIFVKIYSRFLLRVLQF